MPKNPPVPKMPPTKRLPQVRHHEVMYKPAVKPGVSQGTAVWQYAPPDRTTVFYDDKKSWSRYRPGTAHDDLKLHYQPNPCVVVGGVAKKWRPITWLPYPPPPDTRWREEEEEEHDTRNKQLAASLGYETLVGNLIHMDIPGATELNHSWRSYLSDDVMEWGFPYYKGTKERVKSWRPRPFLSYQLKEKLWKFPRTKNKFLDQSQ